MCKIDTVECLVNQFISMVNSEVLWDALWLEFWFVNYTLCDQSWGSIFSSAVEMPIIWSHHPLPLTKRWNMDLIDQGKSHNMKTEKGNRVMQWKASTAVRFKSSTLTVQPVLAIALIRPVEHPSLLAIHSVSCVVFVLLSLEWLMYHTFILLNR